MMMSGEVVTIIPAGAPRGIILSVERNKLTISGPRDVRCPELLSPHVDGNEIGPKVAPIELVLSKEIEEATHSSFLPLDPVSFDMTEHPFVFPFFFMPCLGDQ